MILMMMIQVLSMKIMMKIMNCSLMTHQLSNDFNYLTLNMITSGYNGTRMIVVPDKQNTKMDQDGDDALNPVDPVVKDNNYNNNNNTNKFG